MLKAAHDGYEHACRLGHGLVRRAIQVDVLGQSRLGVDLKELRTAMGACLKRIMGRRWLSSSLSRSLWRNLLRSMGFRPSKQLPHKIGPFWVDAAIFKFADKVRIIPFGSALLMASENRVYGAGILAAQQQKKQPRLVDHELVERLHALFGQADAGLGVHGLDRAVAKTEMRERYRQRANVVISAYFPQESIDALLLQKIPMLGLHFALVGTQRNHPLILPVAPSRTLYPRGRTRSCP